MIKLEYSSNKNIPDFAYLKSDCDVIAIFGRVKPVIVCMSYDRTKYLVNIRNQKYFVDTITREKY